MYDFENQQNNNICCQSQEKNKRTIEKVRAILL